MKGTVRNHNGGLISRTHKGPESFCFMKLSVRWDKVRHGYLDTLGSNCRGGGEGVPEKRDGLSTAITETR